MSRRNLLQASVWTMRCSGHVDVNSWPTAFVLIALERRSRGRAVEPDRGRPLFPMIASDILSAGRDDRQDRIVRILRPAGCPASPDTALQNDGSQIEQTYLFFFAYICANKSE